MIKYFSLLAVLGILAIGLYFVGGNDEELSPSSDKTDNIAPEEILAVLPIDESIETEVVGLAEKFLDAYVIYEQEKPAEYLEKIKPIVSKEFYAAHAERPKRESLEVIAYSWDREESLLSLVNAIKPEQETSMDEVTVYAEILRNRKTNEGTEQEWKEYWMEMSRTTDKWLVSEVNIKDGKQHLTGQD